MLLGEALSISSLNTPGARSLTHALTWGINMVIFTNLIQFMLPKMKKRSGGCCIKWGPLTLVCLGSFLVMLDLTRHVVGDSYPDIQWLHMYKDVPGPNQLSVTGWVVSVGCTWVGYICLMVGVFWAMSIVTKMKRKWSSMRGPAPAAVRSAV